MFFAPWRQAWKNRFLSPSARSCRKRKIGAARIPTAAEAQRLDDRVLLSADPAPFVVTLTPDSATSNSTAHFTATFSEPVTGVDATDFTLARGPGLSGGAITDVTPNAAGDSYAITVSGLIDDGTLAVNLVDDGSIVDASGNRLTQSGFSAAFESQPDFAAGAAPHGVAIGDLNGDLQPDLAVANFNGATVSVLLGNGDGTFQSQTALDTGNSPIAVAMADIDEDGNLDLLTANRASSTFSLLLGNGDGSFQPQVQFGTGSGPQSVAVDDLNGDGHLDVATSNRYSETVSVLLGNGDGTFQVGQEFPAGRGLGFVAIGDLNGDSKPDLVTANSIANTASVLLGNGDGTFQPQQVFGTGPEPVWSALGDVNGDGNLDFVTANRDGGLGNTVSFLQGNGDGSFQPKQDLVSGAANSEPFAVALGDVNGDAKADIITANNGSSTAGVLLGNGDGTFQPNLQFAAGANPHAVAVADLDGDGRPEIVTANFSGLSASVLLNSLNGDFTGDTTDVAQVDPVIGSFGGIVSWTEGTTAVLISSTATLSDDDSADFHGGAVTVSLTANAEALDRLAIRYQGTGPTQISISGNQVYYGPTLIGTFTGGVGATDLVVSLNANATPARTQALLRNLSYSSSSDNPSPLNRTVSVQVTDGSGGSGNATKQIKVIPVSTPPVIGSFGADISYTENAAPALVASLATVSDADSTNFDTGTLTVKLTANGTSADRLAIRNQGTGATQINISGNQVFYGPTQIGTFAGGTGTTPLVVTLNANATPGKTQALLRNITFANVSESPSGLARTVSAQLTDGDGGLSAAVTKQINVIPVADKPVIGSFGSNLSYTENGLPLVIASLATVTDIDSPNFNTGTLTVKFSANGSSGDRLTVRTAGNISVNDATQEISYSGVVIGTYTGGAGLTPLVITLNAQATPAKVQVLLRNVTYSNVSDNPGSLTRTVFAQLTDGTGGTSVAVTKQIAVTAVNDKPDIGSFGGDLSYTENGVPLAIASLATVTDPDSANFDTGKLTVKLTVNASAADRLTVRNAGSITVNDATQEISYSGVVIGTFTGGTGLTPLVITFNAQATLAKTQAVLRNVAYSNVSDNPTTLTRTVSAQLTDGDGGTSLALTKQIAVTAVNDKPVIASFGGDVSYVAGGAPLVLTTTATVTDADSANFDTGKLVVKYTTGAEAADRLEIRTAGNISVNQATKEVSYAGVVIGIFAGGGGTAALTITFNDQATAGKVQALLRNITYHSVSGTPSTTPRTVQAQLFDGDGAASIAVTKQINVAASAATPTIAEVDAAFAAYGRKK